MVQTLFPVLHTEKQAFQCAALQSRKNILLHSVAYWNHTMQPGFYIAILNDRSLCSCVSGHAHSCSVWAEIIANTWLPFANIWKTLQGHIFKGVNKKSIKIKLQFQTILHATKLLPEVLPNAPNIFTMLARKTNVVPTPVQQLVAPLAWVNSHHHRCP